MLLEVSNINTFYGESHVLHNVSLEVKENEIVSLIGRNGAGKTTTLLSIMGLNPPKSGHIIYKSDEITQTLAHLRARMGIGYVPEGRGLFVEMTVMENLRIAAQSFKDPEGIEKSLELFPDLKRYLNKSAGKLSGGEQQMLAIARGMIGKKSLIMLDEPMLGLMPKIVQRLVDVVSNIKKEMSVILVEQSIDTALDLADRVYIMRDGTIAFKGLPDEVRKNKDVEDLLVLK